MVIVVQIWEIVSGIVEVDIVVIKVFQVRPHIITTTQGNHSANLIRVFEVSIGREEGPEASPSGDWPGLWLT